MPPKPFPYPIGIGIDVCKPSRILRLMQDHQTLNRWLRKVFNRLEWPQLVSRFKVAQNAAPGDSADPQDDFNRYEPLILSYWWSPPPAGSEHIQVPAITDALAQHLAGRLEAPPPYHPPPISPKLFGYYPQTTLSAETMLYHHLDGLRRKQ